MTSATAPVTAPDAAVAAPGTGVAAPAAAPEAPEYALLPSARPVSFIDADGRAAAPGPRPYPVPDDTELVAAHRALVVGRRLDQQATNLAKQGELAVYPSSLGQEACQIGAALALGPQDWLFPTYRDCVAIMTRGVDPVETLTLMRGDWHCGYDPVAHRIAPQCTPLATQAPHAVGLAHAARLRGEDTVALVLIGDGATSEGDFHEALNFAAVFKAPVVFLVQNNAYAISVPLDRQTAAPSLAHKGIGYGMPGERVDGNDVAAVLGVLRHAVERARRGEGPTLVEAHTYRMEPHSNADDAGRYRDADEVARWRHRDPIARLETYLTERGLLTDADVRAAADEAEERAAALRTGIVRSGPPSPDALLREVTADDSAQLARDRELLLRELEREEDTP
ncbi:pyruvate dehydrogenase (acetyl-transferring) E1 component subunit alpha [Streptomyces coeruleoprunus]|uniref:Pyruvate dehydrogenase (Acetyl-transferring) E1 component subunit alpha n=1 Tax=Streptomyces coeruleoprunus TaxID=285563 RepID=A0ABV9XFF8_9ACTN